MIRLIGYLAFVVSLMACAKIVPPDGGDRDLDPPLLLAVDPPNESVNFKANSVYLSFDEYVQLADIYNQLIVSPPLRERPEIKLRKRGVEVTFMEQLLPDVTYTLNFGEGIKDYTEGNAATVVYVFSTGDALDSLVYAGRVIDAYTSEPLKDVRVLLHKNLADSIPLTEKPYYVARSGEDGFFQFDYLASGDYRLFALEESNLNYLFDDPTERIAYLSEPIQPYQRGDSVRIPVLRLSQERDSTVFIQNYSADSSGFLQMQLQGAYRNDVQLIASDSSLGQHVYFIPPDSLFAWVDQQDGREFSWFFEAGERRDTLLAETFTVGKRKLGFRSKLPSTVSADDTLKLSFVRPINALDTSRIRVFRDSVLLAAVPFVKKETAPFDVQWQLPLEDGGSYRVLLDPAAVTSREGWENDTLVWKFKVHPKEHYGKVVIRLGGLDAGQKYFLELYREGQVTSDRKVEITQERTYSFERLLPATYRLRLVHDVNGNGQWDPASYLRGGQPEVVVNLAEPIQVRSNWDFDMEWTIEN